MALLSVLANKVFKKGLKNADLLDNFQSLKTVIFVLEKSLKFVCLKWYKACIIIIILLIIIIVIIVIIIIIIIIIITVIIVVVVVVVVVVVLMMMIIIIVNCNYYYYNYNQTGRPTW